MLREKSWDKILTLRQSGRVGPMSGDEGKSLDAIHLTAASYNAGVLYERSPFSPDRLQPRAPVAFSASPSPTNAVARGGEERRPHAVRSSVIDSPSHTLRTQRR